MKFKRRWTQVSLRTVFVLLSVFCVWFGWHANRANRQRRAVERIVALGGTVGYDYQLTVGPHGDYVYDPKTEPDQPAWLRALFGPHFFDRAITVTLNKTAVTDDDLAVLHDLPDIELLSLSHTRIGDAGMAHVGNLPGIEALTLCHTQIGDAGMAHVGQLRELRALSLWNVPVGDEGIRHLSQCPKLENLVLDGTRITDAGLAHLANLTELEEWLGLVDTAITDSGVAQLSRLKKLKILNLRRTGVTADGYKRLLQLLPETSVSIGP